MKGTISIQGNTFEIDSARLSEEVRDRNREAREDHRCLSAREAVDFLTELVGRHDRMLLLALVCNLTDDQLGSLWQHVSFQFRDQAL